MLGQVVTAPCGPERLLRITRKAKQEHALMRRETPAVAKNSSSRSNAVQQIISPSPIRSPYFSVAFSCTGNKASFDTAYEGRKDRCARQKARDIDSLQRIMSTKQQLCQWHLELGAAGKLGEVL